MEETCGQVTIEAVVKAHLLLTSHSWSAAIFRHILDTCMLSPMMFCSLHFHYDSGVLSVFPSCKAKWINFAAYYATTIQPNSAC